MERRMVLYLIFSLIVACVDKDLRNEEQSTLSEQILAWTSSSPPPPFPKFSLPDFTLHMLALFNQELTQKTAEMSQFWLAYGYLPHELI